MVDQMFTDEIISEILNLDSCFQAEDMARFAEDVPGFQKFLINAETDIESLNHKAEGIMLQGRKRNSKRDENENLKNKAEADIARLEAAIPTITDEKLLESANLELAKAKYDKLRFQSRLNEKLLGYAYLDAKVEALILADTVRELRKGILKTIEDYFKTGNYGTGTVTFEGVEYTAS
ncbi:hypothetical protein FUAX_19400 [Fulvitalea axinellae]|uniref:Uncharacterized protein n=1 Tax=Fulvitalea axinellae TaxID=1182444 RepID=A0AAU9CHI4_9BACT|nr:hypothetical protein FUAX_19400 [Fulvitalea axinellae]